MNMGMQEIADELKKNFSEVNKKGGFFSRSFYTLYGPNSNLDSLINSDMEIHNNDYLFYYRFGDGRLAFTNSYFYFSGLPDDSTPEDISAIKKVSHFYASPLSFPVFRIDMDKMIEIILTSQSLGGSRNEYVFHFIDSNEKQTIITTHWNREGNQIYNSIVKLINTVVCRENLFSLVKVKEKNLDYDSAINIYEKINLPEEAARVRILKADLAAPKTEIHGDYVDDRDTIVKDSVINKSNIGAGGDDKVTKLEKIANLKKEGLIDDAEFKQMKKEILGK